uniref:Uncharacterized protein n=2 Tax=Aegilops tauschii subsp. strangulata TaxID=200361 RepID=A0A452Z7L4_AEGTS
MIGEHARLMLEKPEKHPSNLPNLQEVELCVGVVDGHQLVRDHHKVLICLLLICAGDGEVASPGREGARRRAVRSAGVGGAPWRGEEAGSTRVVDVDTAAMAGGPWGWKRHWAAAQNPSFRSGTRRRRRSTGREASAA